ncbi:Anthranilate synthase component 2 [Bienertia sinuspersici]
MLSISLLSNSLTLTSKRTCSFLFLSPTSFSSSPSSAFHSQTFNCPIKFIKNPLLSRKYHNFILKSCSDSESEAEVSTKVEDEWLSRLPDKKKPLYAHSLPCIEAWIRSLGFTQSKEDRAVWFIEKPEWHAQLSLDITEIYIRYMKSGPGKLEKDMERRFSYALSREDIENAVLGGP